MEVLYNLFKPLVDSEVFTVIMDIIIYLNPIALAPQVYKVIKAKSVEGISVTMYMIFFLIQLAFVFHGIKTQSSTVFLSMFISMIESLVIMITVKIKN